MHGGLKIYRGNPAAARHYLVADRSRADDYYLVEGSGFAEHYSATRGPGETAVLHHRGQLDGTSYEQWVSGHDFETGDPKGRLRTDAQGVRFVEVVVNGPKTWSLAAAQHPEIGAAYDAAQQRAAEQIIRWVAEHATSRVGSRGCQVQVPVTEIEAAVVRHYTSRAGDPHRHLHLQINARVLVGERWRGLHTVGVRDSLDAINGIGNAAVMCDPEFRHVLAAHGYALDADTGEVEQLTPYVGAFSVRTSQISRNVGRYESEWRSEHPGEEPGPRLRQTWDRRAWSDARPDKVIPRDGADIASRWNHELEDLTLDIVHRFTDPEYADLSLLMRTGESPERVFDTLLARGEIRIHPTEIQRLQAVSREPGLLIAHSREQVEELNATARDHRRRTRDGDELYTTRGEAIGVGDLIATRLNSADLNVANRERWFVTAVKDDGIEVEGHRGSRPCGRAGL